MQFKEKTVFIISRENFEGMLMSKQHYAIELSRLGSRVYFINHPDLKRKLFRGEINLDKTNYDNLWVINHRFFHPYFLKFKFSDLYNYLTKFHIKRIIKKIGKNPDVVWHFDIGNTLPLKYFPSSSRKIYMPVDGPYSTVQEKYAAKSAEIILSVTDEILTQYKSEPIPKFMINHGVSDIFIFRNSLKLINDKIRIGYSGSLLRSDLDLNLIRTIINQHSDKIFEFWGENNVYNSNIHSSEDISNEIVCFIDYLRNATNVILHGLVKTEDLVDGLKNCDILLIIYKPNDDNTKNSHKILEYLATGNVIVSSYMSSYFDKRGDLIEMISNRESNDEFPILFSNVIANLDYYNSLQKVKDRITYASRFSYKNQIKKVEVYLTEIE